MSIKIGYIRVSTTDQNTTRQEVLMTELGVEKVFIDHISGKNTNRPFSYAFYNKIAVAKPHMERNLLS